MFSTILGILFLPFILTLCLKCNDSYLKPFIFESSDVADSYETYLNSNFEGFGSFGKRFPKIVIAYLGAFLLNGLLVSLFVTWIQNRKSRWERGDLHYKSIALGNYCVVLGVSDMVPKLVGDLLKDKVENKAVHKYNHVLVMTTCDVPTLRKKFVSLLEKEEEKVVIYYGDHTSQTDLKRLQIDKGQCKEIYVIGEEMDFEQKGSHHDVKNMECVRMMADLLEGTSNSIPCHVLFDYQSTYSVFQFTDISEKIGKRYKDNNFVPLDFSPFNYYETWAQRVFVCECLNLTEKQNWQSRNQADQQDIHYLPLEGTKPITMNEEDTVHLIVVGMSRMGIALAVQAAHLAHYPNFISKGKKSRITFIDSHAKQEMNFFQGHYKELFAVASWRFLKAKEMNACYEENELFVDEGWHHPISDAYSQSPYKQTEGYSIGDDVADIEWQFIEGNLETPAIQQFIRDEAQKQQSRLTIAICFPKDNASLAAALYLPDEVYEKEKKTVQQILVFQPFGEAMFQSLNKEPIDTKGFHLLDKLKPFGMLNKLCCVNLLHELGTYSGELAKKYIDIAEDMRSGLRKKMNIKKPMPQRKTGKSFTAKKWSDKYSFMHLWTKLRSVIYNGTPFDDATKELLAKVEHSRWNMEQLLMGFAPLRPSEQSEIKSLMGRERNCVPGLEEAIGRLKEDQATDADKRLITDWLAEWEKFDATKEEKKSEMSHLDICTYDVLKIIDCDAFTYDLKLVEYLPEIYKQIIEEKDGNANEGNI